MLLTRFVRGGFPKASYANSTEPCGVPVDEPLHGGRHLAAVVVGVGPGGSRRRTSRHLAGVVIWRRRWVTGMRTFPSRLALRRMLGGMSDVTPSSAIEQGDPHAAERAAAAGLRRAAQARRRAGWPRRSPARRSRPPPWSTRRTSGWSAASRAQHWNSRGHFFAAAAEAMRRILVENARRKQAEQARRRTGSGSISTSRRSPPPAPDDDLLALDEALDRLAAHDPPAAELVKLRYFAGLTVERGRRGPGHLPRHRRPALGLRPGLAAPPSCATATSRDLEFSVPSLRRLAPDSSH